MIETIWAARPTTYSGVRMRSRLEADFARALDRGNADWEYEPECFASKDGQYLPDFKVSGPIDRYIELKPVGWDAVAETLARMEIVWASRPDAMLVFALWQYGWSDQWAWPAAPFLAAVKDLHHGNWNRGGSECRDREHAHELLRSEPVACSCGRC